MGIWAVVLLFLLGLALIIKGGDFFVDAASWIAEASGIPKFIIGATIVSMATTLPELLVSLMAAGKGSVGIAIGNAVGSVTANVGLIMGISILAIPAMFKRGQLLFKSLILLAACVLIWVFSMPGSLGLAGAIVLLVLFSLFVANNVWEAKASMTVAQPGDAPRAPTDQKTVVTNIVKFVLGAAGIVFGADLLVDNGTLLAQFFGVPDSIIGATLVAVGTSLPELVTTITAIVKKESALSVGNILGANIIDMTVILPLCAILSGGSLPILRQNLVLDMPVCLGIVAFALVPALISQKFRRAQGVVLLVLYAAYIVVLCTGVFA